MASIGTSARKHVVIVGCGFGGFQAAKELGRRLVPRWADVTVIEPRPGGLFTPLLYEAAVGEIQTRRLRFPLRPSLDRLGIRLLHAAVAGLDLQSQQIRAGDEEISYDQLILAGGSRPSLPRKPGIAAHAYPLKTDVDAERLQARLEECARLAAAAAPGEQSRLLTFAIVGAGPTGVELAASLKQALRERLLRRTPALQGAARVLLIEACSTILSGMPAALAQAATRELKRDGIEILLEAPVDDLQEGMLFARGQPPIEAGAVIWTAGVRPVAIPGLEGASRAPDGRFLVDRALRLPDQQEVFVIGDMVSAEAPDGMRVPACAPAAIQMGRLAGRNVTRALLGLPPITFRYHYEGDLLALGRHNAVAYLGGRTFTGVTAWAARRAVYLASIMGVRNRAGLALDWWRADRAGQHHASIR